MVDRIDEIDVHILRLLQRSGRMKRNQIAEEIGLSLPSASERIRKLEERGVIVGYSAVVNAKRLHVDVCAFISVRVDGSRHYAGFVEAAAADSEILEVHSITGQGSHMLKVRTRNTDSLEKLLDRIQRWPGVASTITQVVLSTFKETRQLDTEPMDLAPRETRE